MEKELLEGPTKVVSDVFGYDSSIDDLNVTPNQVISTSHGTKAISNEVIF